MLVLRPTKTGVRFEYVDDDSETTISLDKSDDDETMCRKLRKVLALVDSKVEESAPPTLENMFAAAVNREKQAAVTGNGWEAYAKPEVPDRLKGKVEMIEEGE